MNASRRLAQQLNVSLSDLAAQHALQQAINAVPGFATGAHLPEPGERLLTGVASLAIGDAEFSRELLDHVDGAAFLLLAARHFLWTGQDTVFRGQLQRIRESLTSVPPFAELRELDMALESAGEPVTHAGAGPALLPVWSAAAWPDYAPQQPARSVAAFVHATLGAAPDAPRGRLRLRPWLPADLQSLNIENLRVGDAAISLHYRQSANVIEYRVEQMAGAIPVRLIFEPTFSRRVTRIIVDEAPAELALQPLEERIVAPVQLMLDHQRTIRFELE